MFRKMTPKELDEALPRLQVLARSSPEDKYLLVCRLNGSSLPENKAEWEEKHRSKGMYVCVSMYIYIYVHICMHIYKCI
jgi:hypothetical protein